MTEFGERYRDAIEAHAEWLFERFADGPVWAEVSEWTRDWWRTNLGEPSLLAATTEIPCPVCGGTGGYVDAGSEPSPCLLCGGSGVLRVLEASHDVR